LRKIALLVEIGEVANELKSFKYWKKDKKIDLEKVQEELIDCLHFFLSLVNGSQINFNEYFSPKIENKLDTNRLLLIIFKATARLYWLKEEKTRKNKKDGKIYYYYWLSNFEKLCWQINFDEKKLLEVYRRKNEINKQRQLENY
jgi:dimeric dUTPase (all-alpha-NTP-PPase superfamily)